MTKKQVQTLLAKGLTPAKIEAALIARCLQQIAAEYGISTPEARILVARWGINATQSKKAMEAA